MTRRSAYWVLVGICSLLAVVTVVPLGIYAWQIESQRALQAELESRSDILFFAGDEHWLTEWLPASLAARLPSQGVRLFVGNDEEVAVFRQYSQRLRGVRELTFMHCQLTEADWQLVLGQENLETIELCAVDLEDDCIPRLARLERLSKIEIAHMPLTDASLAAFSRIQALECLVLRDTQVSLVAIEAFALTHPHLKIGCDRSFTSHEREARDELESAGIEAFTSATDYIARKYRWQLILPADFHLTPSLQASIEKLDGPVIEVEFIGPVTPEILDLLKTRKTIERVSCPDVSSVETIEQLAQLASIKSIKLSEKSISPHQFLVLNERFGNKIESGMVWVDP